MFGFLVNFTFTFSIKFNILDNLTTDLSTIKEIFLQPTYYIVNWNCSVCVNLKQKYSAKFSLSYLINDISLLKFIQFLNLYYIVCLVRFAELEQLKYIRLQNCIFLDSYNTIYNNT